MEQELREAMLEYTKAHAEKTAAEARKEVAKTKILLLLKKNGVDKFNDGVCMTKLSTYKRSTQDKEALEAYIHEVSGGSKELDDFKEEAEYERLVVKVCEV